MRTEGLIELPNGQCIFYKDEDHSYWRAREVPVPPAEATSGLAGMTRWKRSTRLTGASTLCKPYSYDSGRLLAWKEKVTCEGVATLVRDHTSNPGDVGVWDWLTDGDVIRSRLKEAGQDADSVRDRKATVGTNVHTALEQLAAEELPDPTDYPVEERGYVEAVINWWHNRKPTVLNCEQFVYSETHGFAGRFDMRATFRDPDQSFDDAAAAVTRLVDLKTSGWIAPSMHVQLELYELAARECGVGSSDQRIILQVKDDGTYREVPCRATEQDALNAIAVYRGAGRIERESGLPRAA